MEKVIIYTNAQLALKIAAENSKGYIDDDLVYAELYYKFLQSKEGIIKDKDHELL